jgi:hypothetical protein
MLARMRARHQSGPIPNRVISEYKLRAAGGGQIYLGIGRHDHRLGIDTRYVFLIVGLRQNAGWSMGREKTRRSKMKQRAAKEI